MSIVYKYFLSVEENLRSKELGQVAEVVMGIHQTMTRYFSVERYLQCSSLVQHCRQ